jgi:hypothetical protein
MIADLLRNLLLVEDGNWHNVGAYFCQSQKVQRCPFIICFSAWIIGNPSMVVDSRKTIFLSESRNHSRLRIIG